MIKGRGSRRKRPAKEGSLLDMWNIGPSKDKHLKVRPLELNFPTYNDYFHLRQQWYWLQGSEHREQQYHHCDKSTTQIHSNATTKKWNSTRKWHMHIPHLPTILFLTQHLSLVASSSQIEVPLQYQWKIKHLNWTDANS